jgi:8-oxo-dGTP pyrophosphatase MutT (NUDIX family)
MTRFISSTSSSLKVTPRWKRDDRRSRAIEHNEWVVHPLQQALADYRAGDAAEERDLERVRALLQDDDPWARSKPLHVTGSGLIVHLPTRRVLLRWHARQQAWLQVGGHGDPGESDPLAVALREGHEETGLGDLRAWPDGRIVHVVVVPVPAGKGEPAHEHADVRFVLRTGQPDSATPDSEGAALRWLTLDEAHEANQESNLRETLRRVRLLLEAAR